MMEINNEELVEWNVQIIATIRSLMGKEKDPRWQV
jgi:hypothetical protein